MTTVSVGQTVRLKPDRARAYGFDPATIYKIAGIHSRGPQYKVPWVALAGVGVVKRSELVAA